MSDFCLVAKRLSVEIDGARVDEGAQSWEDLQEGNQYDTEFTVKEVLEFNEVYDKLCRDTVKE